ncbi:MAG: sodium:solute symporter family protein [Candidatus Adiutrix sp.]
MVFFVFMLVILSAVAISLLSKKGVVPNSINDVLVASGSFGPILLFFIMVGENYTTGTVLGAPGSIYSKGASYGFWFISYILLAYCVGYFLCPALWRLGRLSNGATVGDLLGWRFDSKLVQVAIALCSIIFLIPNVQIQLIGLGIVFKYLDLGLSFEQAVLLSIVVAFVMVMISGIRAPAYVSILKDTLLLVAILLVGFVCIVKADGGVYGIFNTVAQTLPELLTVPDKPPTAGLTFTMSTVFFQMLVLNLFPILVSGTLTSASETNVRRSIVIMPLYMIMFPFLVITAYFALISVPDLERADYALLAVAITYLPPWLVGLIAGGVALTGILVICVNALTIGGLFSKNILLIFRPQISQQTLINTVRIVTGVTLLISGALALFSPNLLATILTMAYNGMAQILVAFAFAFFWKKGTKEGIVSGMITALMFLLLFEGALPFALNKGLCALLLNVAVAVPVSLMTKAPELAVARFEQYQKTTPWTFER